MPSKIFISFLGAIPYHETQYYWRPDRSDLSEPTVYVQESIIRNCLPVWTEGDKIFIFTTKDAKHNNYHNRITGFDKKTNTSKLENSTGLESSLNQLNDEKIISHFEPVVIPNGYTEKEILQIFQQIFERIEPSSEIYFDITVGFRSLPMLGILLLNYAKNVVDADVKAIYYGNYEAGRAEQEEYLELARHKQLPGDELDRIKKSIIKAPILNLISLSNLQDWTSAAREFIKLGKAEGLADLVKETQPDLAEQLSQFEQSIATCRGKLLTQDLNINALKNILEVSKNEPIKEQLKPLLAKIEAKISHFETGETLQNGLAAVDWCIQHNMIQQGITFLQETLISHIVEKITGKEVLNELFYREMAATALLKIKSSRNKIFFKKEFLEQPEEDQNKILNIYEQMRAVVKAKENLSAQYRKLTGSDGFRNDINHCGFRENYQSPKELKGSLIELFENIKNLNL